MQFILETRRAHQIRYQRFYNIVLMIIHKLSFW